MIRSVLFAAALLPVLVWGGPGQAAAPAKPTGDKDICRTLTAQAELRHRIPKALLGAVAVTESGRWDASRSAVSAWPWAINAEGRGQFFETKAAAVAEVKKLQKRGIRSIDVGCMQVNLLHHADAFASVEAAFDPATNVDYAARFLLELQDKTRSWTQAVAHYHSATPALHVPYRQKVLANWSTEMRRTGEDSRQAVAVAYETRQAELVAAYQARQAELMAAQRANIAQREASLAAARLRTQQLAQMSVGQTYR